MSPPFHSILHSSSTPLCPHLPLSPQTKQKEQTNPSALSAHNTRNGPSEFTVTGSLKKWDIRPSLHKIAVPTLLLNGRYDEAQDEVVEPYFRAIGKVKWYRFAESSHMPQLEEREEFMKVVVGFLLG